MRIKLASDAGENADFFLFYGASSCAVMQDGSRVEIHSLSDGRPFHADSTYTVAINSYRGNGGGGHLTQGVGWTKADINQRILKIWDKDVRYYITEYIKEKKVLTPRCRNDWKVIPEAWFQAGKKQDYKIIYESH